MKLGRAVLIGISLASMMFAADESLERLKSAGEVLGDIEGTADKAIPNSLFQKANCVIVIPGMKKAGFLFSGKYGRGFASCRKTGGGWTAPAGMRMEGGGFGLQIGASETDIIMLIMSKKGRDGILDSKFTLGGEISAAAGPVGRDITAQTDATMKADILSWSRSRGIFGGLSLQGGTMRADDEANKAFYGDGVSTRNILTGTVKKPAPSPTFNEMLVKYGGVKEQK